ncbi:hypothetical protein [Ancylobacter pratisalsi]|uniref:DUF2946 domain-containing protein n=1 Tax=Ancylobacter pratisalsi TaxID=1745854 RepID=A0A6P1YIS8_9HYPH|nr:hypothetical protein [Ancylobacter pratisalsi]QIB33045.1 hypothetical protein G3A50_04435 [Ancylobacter pratisalsi]
MRSDGLSLRLLRLIFAVVALGVPLAGPSGTAMAMAPQVIMAPEAMTALQAMPCHEAGAPGGPALANDHGAAGRVDLVQRRGAVAGAAARLYPCCVIGWLVLAPFADTGLSHPMPDTLAFAPALSLAPAGWTHAIPEPPPRTV